MGTSAQFIVRDGDSTVNVYAHWDGYPRGACVMLRNALNYAWPRPRFEAVDFAAAIVAGNKQPGGGSIYIDDMGGDFTYDITFTGGDIRVQAKGPGFVYDGGIDGLHELGFGQ